MSTYNIVFQEIRNILKFLLKNALSSTMTGEIKNIDL